MTPTVIHEKCSGCGTCKLACAMENFSAVQPARRFCGSKGAFPHREITRSIFAISAASALTAARWMPSPWMPGFTAWTRTFAPVA